MPRLKNPNHEKFSREYAKALSEPNGKVVASKIYKQGYAVQDHTARSNAPELLAKTAIQSRIQDIIQELNPPKAISEDLARLRKLQVPIVSNGKILGEKDDGATQLGAINACLKAYGLGNQDIDARSLTFNLPPNTEDIKAMQGLVDKLDGLASKLGVNEINTKAEQNEIGGGGGVG